jgi:hypothetical protein
MNANVSFVQIFNVKSLQTNRLSSNVNISSLQNTVMSTIDNLLTPDIEPYGTLEFY